MPTPIKNTPNGKRYFELEGIFALYASHLGKTCRELDFEIWTLGHEGKL